MASLHIKETNPSKRATTQLYDLPNEILSEILSRLPITSLALVKYTCKLWRTIINDGMFPELHLTHALKNPGHLYALKGDDLNLCFAEKVLNKTVGIKIRREVAGNVLGEFKFYGRYVLPIGHTQYSSCHGLVCYSPLGGDIYIFNPITQERVRIPQPHFNYKCVFGFGYEPLTKKYKCYCSSYDMRHVSSQIYTLGDDSWRNIEDLGLNMCTPVCCKGLLYWNIGQGISSDEIYEFEPGNHVVSLDLQTEKFRVRPVSCTKCLVSQSYLTLIGETVAMVLHSKKTMKILVLKDEASDYWFHMYNIRYDVSNRLKFSKKLQFFGLWMNQDLYCISGLETLHNASIVRCISKRADADSFSPIQLPFAKDADEHDISPQLVITHVGSLVSPRKIMGLVP